MKSQKRHSERQVQHSFELAQHARKVRLAVDTAKAYVVGGLIIGGYFLLMGAFYVYYKIHGGAS